MSICNELQNMEKLCYNDHECGNLQKVIEKLLEEKMPRRRSLKGFICRLDRPRREGGCIQDCPFRLEKDEKKLDCFVLVKPERGRSLCFHIECKKSKGKLETILKKLKEKIEGYQHYNDCFCFENADPCVAAIIKLESRPGCPNLRRLYNLRKKLHIVFLIYQNKIEKKVNLIEGRCQDDPS
jgi:hypothetical protein